MTHQKSAATSTSPTSTGASGGEIAPQRPAALALAPEGGPYISDDIRNQVLERLPGGRFRVVAGNGTKGY